MFSLNEIKQRALSKSYQLGMLLYHGGKVRDLSVSGNTVTAIVSGQHDYHVTLIQCKPMQSDPIQVSCTCPAAAYQDICKHAVAVAVALLVENTPVAERVNETDNEAARHAQLVTWFKQKSVDQLSELLMAYIDASEHEFDKWQLTMRSEENGLDETELSKLITKALPEQGVWEWNEVRDYFVHAMDMFEVIFPAIGKLPIAKQWQLILKTLKRLNKVLEQIHDSGDFRFSLEDQLKQQLVILFNQQSWSDEKKADWLFDQFESYEYDIFPDVPDDFALSEPVNQAFLAKCLTALESRTQSGNLSDRSYRWSIMRLAQPLINQAKQAGDWREQCRLLKMSAFEHDDYLKISSVCLENKAELEAEDYLRQAYQQAKAPYEKAQCQEHEVQVRVALGEYKSAWRIAWQLFTDTPSFMAYKKLETLQQKTGEIDAQFIEKTEQLLADCYVETSRGFSRHFDSVLDFYIDRSELEKARLWAASHKACERNLIRLANLIISEHPQDAVDFIERAANAIISQTKNSAYQEATELFLKLENDLKVKQTDSTILYPMIAQIIKQHKAKRNLMKLLKEHFARCFR